MRPHLLRCFEEGQIYIVPVTRMTQLPRVTMIECSLCKNADFFQERLDYHIGSGFAVHAARCRCTMHTHLLYLMI